jgi:uncharacterized membrane protein
MEKPGRVKGWEVALVILITSLAAYLRWHRVGALGMWLDEAFSVWMARQPVDAMLSWIASIDQHPPLYYLLLHGWLHLGSSESTVRSLSALLGTVTVPVLYLLARRLLGIPSAAAAALLLALSPFHVRFSQETRMYTLLTLNAAVALLALAYLLTGDHRKRWWATYILFTALTLFSHNTAVLFPVAVNAGVGVAALVAKTGRSSPNELQSFPAWQQWCGAQLLILLIWLPWSPSFARQAVAVDREFWIQPPTADTVRQTFNTFISAWLPADAAWVWVAALVALALGVVALWRRPWLFALLVTLFLTPILLELLVSIRRPIFYDRTLIWTIIPLFLVFSAGLSLPRWSALPAATAVSAIIVANVLSLQAYYDTFRKEEWREAAAWLDQRVRDNDLILFNATWVQIPFDYYFDRTASHVTKHGAPVDMFDAGVLEPKLTEADVPRLQDLTRTYNCVWLVYSHDWYTDPRRIVPRTLRAEMTPRKQQRFVGLEVQLYERRDGGEDCLKRP